MWTLCKKEIKGFFSSLTAYVVMVVFLLANAAFIWLFSNPMNLIGTGYASLESMFELAPWIFLFLVPAITMRMVAEEKRSGTLDLLFTRPVYEGQIIGAKFLAAWILVLFSLLPTLVWFWSVYRLGSPVGNMDLAGTWGSYLGLLFLGGIYASIGIFASSLSENQIVAFLLAVLLSFLMFRGFEFMGDSAGSGKVALLITRAGISYHYSSMSRGVLDSRDIIYFLVAGGLFLGASVLVLQGRNWRRRYLKWILVAVLLTTAVSVLSGIRFFRIDLTADKQHSLASGTREKLRSLEDVVFVRVYLEGEMPAEFVNFRNKIDDLLEECQAYAGEKLQYEFVNLYEEEDEALRNSVIGELYDQGLRVTSVQIREKDGGSSSRILFPGAIVSYRDYRLPVNLLKNNPGLSHEMNLNNSIQTLEYEFMRAIHSMTLEEVPRIAFTEGHGELDSLQTYSIMNELKNFFQVDRGYINGNLDALMNYKAVIVARPMTAFSEADKFALDQYIMRGGKALFFLDPVNPFADSLSGGTTVALANPVGLEDLLFKYGIRISYNLLADMQCSPVPVNTASTGEEPRFTLMPWVYNPLFSGAPDHPVTRGLNYVKGEFSSTLDTVGPVPGLKRTVLLAGSPASRIRDVPLYISMEEIMVQPDRALYRGGPYPVAILSEGVFPSFYKNYPVPAGVTPARTEVLPESQPTSVLVVSDGGIPGNEISFEQGAYRAQPLGYDRYTRQTFGNLDFVMNAINQMCDETGIMELRSREFKLRLLNRELISGRSQVMKWKMLNAGLPILLVILAGLVLQFLRKRKYSR